MIFVTLGSQKFQFNRLLKEIDGLIEQGIIKEEVFAQIGYSDYLPKHFKYKQFLDRDEFSQYQEQSDIVITHGGTGAIIGALKKGKKVIAVPRLAKYGEHVDDHQEQIIEQFTKSNLILTSNSNIKLSQVLKNISSYKLDKFESNNDKFVDEMRKNIDQSTRCKMVDNHEKRKNSLLLLIFFILPFFDSLNGYLVHSYNLSIGPFYHGLLTLFLMWYSKISIIHFAKRLFIPFLFVLISIIGNYLLYPNYILNFGWLFKITSFIINIICISKLISRDGKYYDFKNIILVSGLMIPIIIIILKIFGVGNNSYLGVNNGFIGLYSSSNELNIMLLSFLGIYFFYFTKRVNLIHLIPIILLCVTLLFIESKSSIILTLFILSVFIFQKVKINKKIISKNVVILFLISFLIAIMSLKNVIFNFIKRQIHLFEYFMSVSNGNVFAYLTSGRLLRVSNIFENLNFDNLSNTLISIFHVLFGNGYLNVGEYAIEMEVFDTFQWFGLVGVVMVLLIYNHYFIASLKTKNIMAIAIVLCIIAFSFTAGHVLYGGTCGIYIAIVLALIDNYKFEKGEESSVS